MPLDIVEAPADVETPQPTDTESLADHEAAYGPTGRGRNPLQVPLEEPAQLETGDEPASADAARDEAGRFVKHRASSQKAQPEDVAQINALTKELRDTEAQLKKLNPQALTGTPRLIALQQRVRAVKAELADASPKSPAPAVSGARAEPAPAASGTFAEPEPTLDSFNQSADPYSAWQRALAKWDRKKEAWEAQQETTAKSQQEADAAAMTAFRGRLAKMAETKPDFPTVTKAFMAQHLPVLLLASLVADDNGAESVYYLAQHPDLVDELFLLTEGKPVTDAHVAIVQRRVKQHVQAATTGSAAVAPTVYTPPRPPNPVRTGPIRTGTEHPGDESSLAEHERAYSRRR